MTPASPHPRFVHYCQRAERGLEPVPHGRAVLDWLAREAPRAARVIDPDVRTAPCRVFDFSVGSLWLGADPAATATPVRSARLFRELEAAGVELGVGRYAEIRTYYGDAGLGAGEQRTVHLGIDLYARAGTAVYAPLAGTVHCFGDNAASRDFGPLIVLRHTTDGGEVFFTLYGHLSRASLAGLEGGREVARGERIGTLGSESENGDWPPHLHFQLVLDLLELDRDYPGVAPPSRRAVWQALSPDPNVLLGIPAERFPPREPGRGEVLAAYRRRIGGGERLARREPPRIVRGFRQYLWDDEGRVYLDLHGAPHVGHSHPVVVRAIQAQIGLLGSTGHHLHDVVVRCAERLLARLPASLGVCFFGRSAAEAQELALRLARRAGGVAVADETLTALGRLGSHFWGFEARGVEPEIVVLGDPIAGGCPLTAVVTTPEIAASFDDGTEAASTFVGDPVACAAVLAVLDVLEEENLQRNAQEVGGQLLAGLRALVSRHESAGDARGAGFFLGLELVRDRQTLEPAAEEASYVVNRLRERQILTGTDGPFHNVVKIRPPMVFEKRDADFLLQTLDEILSEDPARSRLSRTSVPGGSRPGASTRSSRG